MRSRITLSSILKRPPIIFGAAVGGVVVVVLEASVAEEEFPIQTRGAHLRTQRIQRGELRLEFQERFRRRLETSEEENKNCSSE